MASHFSYISHFLSMVVSTINTVMKDEERVKQCAKCSVRMKSANTVKQHSYVLHAMEKLSTSTYPNFKLRNGCLNAAFLT
jgi:hypothetical protein